MSVSLEALAMAGVNYLESSMDIEEWQRQDLAPPPPHLLAHEEEEEENYQKKKNNEDDVITILLYHVKEYLITNIERTTRLVWWIGKSFMRAILWCWSHKDGFYKQM